MRFYKHTASDTVYILEGGVLFPFSIQGFESQLGDILEGDLGKYRGHKIGADRDTVNGCLDDMEDCTDEYLKLNQVK